MPWSAHYDLEVYLILTGSACTLEARGLGLTKDELIENSVEK